MLSAFWHFQYIEDYFYLYLALIYNFQNKMELLVFFLGHRNAKSNCNTLTNFWKAIKNWKPSKLTDGLMESFSSTTTPLRTLNT